MTVRVHVAGGSHIRSRVMTGSLPIDVPIPYTPSPLARYLLAAQPGHACRVELYAGHQADARVQRYCVRKLGPTTYRGLVLTAGDNVTAGQLAGIEGDREAVRCWLTSMGVPCLRVGPPK